MKLIVGLGNPGCEYENTRHNIGFYYLDILANKLNLTFKEKYKAMYAKTKIENMDVILLKPLTYMNLSGEAVIKFMNYYKIKSEDILVIHDDLDMEMGRIKLKENGSSGGHNGIKNIILNLNTSEFKRLKLGISNNKMIDTKDYVLGKFSEEDLKILKQNETKILNIIDDYFNLPFNDLMSKYNRRD
ncbi:MAG: aminoacyl-tRNA hydrolase [Bacilli bacterium]|nr:aminoacyl-tRNA hydrolase [Bacilli bacterium]